jgi:hypothetical protein
MRWRTLVVPNSVGRQRSGKSRRRVGVGVGVGVPLLILAPGARLRPQLCREVYCAGVRGNRDSVFRFNN